MGGFICVLINFVLVEFPLFIAKDLMESGAADALRTAALALLHVEITVCQLPLQRHVLREIYF